MKKYTGLALAVFLALSAAAFETRAASLPSNTDAPRKELKKFDKFLMHHRNIETDLRANPQMINDAQYLSNHKDLEKFLRENPRVTADLSSDPNYFVERETRYQRHKHHWY